jgi:excisionase family DNA binding protein
MPERTYTTHDIAKICDVYPSSVVNWITTGRLKAYATPGGHHRITREDLIKFLKEFKIPLPKDLAVKPVNVLIVDDDVELTRILTRAFTRRGEEFKVDVCHAGIEALIHIGQSRPDLIVLDMVLPKMDGLQVCRVLKSKAETQNIKIIAISGKKLPFNEKKLSEVNIDAFFRKPLDLIALIDKSCSLMGLQTDQSTEK